MAVPIELNKPEFKVVIKHEGLIAVGGVYVAKVTYRLGVFNYIRKHEDLIMRVDGYDPVDRARKYCEKLNEAQREMNNDG